MSATARCWSHGGGVGGKGGKGSKVAIDVGPLPHSFAPFFPLPSPYRSRDLDEIIHPPPLPNSEPHLEGLGRACRAIPYGPTPFRAAARARPRCGWRVCAS